MPYLALLMIRDKANRVYIVGMMASGKSTIGRLLADRLGMDFIDMDDAIVEKEQMSINEIFDVKGEEYFRKLESDLLNTLKCRNSLIISTGGGAPVFNEGMATMMNTGKVVWLKVSKNEIFDRLKNDKSRPLAKAISKNQLLRITTERNPIYKQAHIRVWNRGDTNAVVSRIIKQL